MSRTRICPTAEGLCLILGFALAAFAMALSVPLLAQTSFVAIGGGASSGGTVQSVDVAVPAYMGSSGGPITNNGTITLTFVPQAQGLIFASPCSGSGAVTWRNLCAADIPTLAPSKITGTAVVDSDIRLTNARTPTAHASTHAAAGSDPVAISASQVSGLAPSATTDTTNAANITSGTLAAARMPALSGDVATTAGATVATIQADSVALGVDTTGGYAGSSTEGGPATTATALDANGTNCSAPNFARGVDASGNCEGAAIASSDLPSHTHAESDVTNLVTDLASKVATTRTISTTSPLSGGGDLSADRTLTCPTCATTTSGGALSATSPVTISAGGVIACATCATSTGITSVNSQTGPGITIAVGSTGSDVNVAAAGNTITVHVPDAGAAARGALNTGAQSIAGVKTFTSSPTSPGTGGGDRFGSGANTSGGFSAAFGPAASAASNGAAFGYNTNASGGGAVAVGSGAVAGGADAVAVGDSASCSQSYSIAAGRSATCTAANQLVIGSGVAGITHIADVYIGSGITDTAPKSVTYHGTSASGATNANGADITLETGKPTGTGEGGDFTVTTTPTVLTSGSTQNTGTIARLGVRAKGVALTNSTAASVIDITLPTLTMAGGKVMWLIVASDGTDVQSLAGTTTYNAVNKGGTYSSQAREVDGMTCACSASSTLSATWSVLNGTNKVTIQVTPVSSLTPTTFRLYYTFVNNSEQAATAL